MRRWPIRLRVAAWAALIGACVLALFGAGTVWHVRAEQIAELDRRLGVEARALFSAWEEHQEDMRDLAAGLDVAGDRQDEKNEVDIQIAKFSRRAIAIFSKDGERLYVSPGPEGEALTPDREAGSPVTTRLADRPVRLARYERKGLVAAIAADLRPIDDAARELIRAFLFSLPPVLLALAAGCWWIARQALRPIDVIAREAEKIGARHLDQRLPVVHAEDELGRLTLVLNRMIARLEASFQEVAQFTSDAAHELRTPLAIMRGEIEAELRSGTGTSEQETFLLSLLGDTAHLSTIVGDLLLLSRADAGRLDLRLETVDLSALVGETVEDAEVLAAPRRIRSTAEVGAGVFVSADPARLRQVLLNLIDNAIKYNHDGGEVRIGLSESSDTAILRIANTGPGIAPEQAARIFQRFYRGDSAHSGEGQGLGLSICRELIHAHGGTLELAESAPGWVEFRIALGPADSRK